MYDRKGPKGTLGGIASCMLIIFLFLGTPIVADSNDFPACKLEAEFGKQIVSESETVLGSDSRGLYEGQLRVYVVQLTSNYNSQDGRPWHNYFLGWAIDSLITLDYLENFSTSVNYTPLSNQPDLEPDNVKVIAVMFDKANGYPRNSDPYDQGAPFTAYLADACAAALPGETGYNNGSGAWSHTVFVEDYSSSG
jgi:hypothetical protein